MKKIILKKGRESSVERFHPWIFSGAVGKITGNPGEGEVVSVYSHDGTLLGCGHYQIGSIAVRILSFRHENIDASFWKERIEAARRLRRTAGLDGNNMETDCYRLIHGEGDNLPGLVVDIYRNVAVMQAHSAGMFIAREKIATALKEVMGSEIDAIYDKSAATAPFKAGLDLNNGYLYCREGAGYNGETGEAIVHENGNMFHVNWIEGQKTGFFLDQRDNRELVKKYSRGKRVLNLFCYTGGFSVYALNGGAASVDSVDSSAKAIELTERNIALNGFGEKVHNSFCCDAIDYLHKSEKGKYDLIVVDPPAFAKHRDAINNALRAYKRLNAAAIEKVAPGGIIFTYSCSQAIDRQNFALAVFSAAAIAGRRVKIIHRLTQPADHPVNIYHPEGEYLKGLALYVE